MSKFTESVSCIQRVSFLPESGYYDYTTESINIINLINLAMKFHKIDSNSHHLTFKYFNAYLQGSS